MRVRARVPEKQGLKPPEVSVVVDLTEVRARVPEKQGLKLRFQPGRRGQILSGREFQKNKD